MYFVNVYEKYILLEFMGVATKQSNLGENKRDNLCLLGHGWMTDNG